MNMDIDYALCIDLLGLNANQFKLTQSVPPHTITYWDGPDPQPTEAECKEVWDVYIGAEPLRLLRVERDQLLASSDWRDLPSYAGTKQAEWRVYRQFLRDITVGLDTVEKVNAVTWPTKPS